MSKHEPRTRTRYEGIPKSLQGLYPLGQVFIEDGLNSGKWHPYGAPKTWSAAETPWTKFERTVDELHGRGPYFDGGPFESIKVERPFAKAGQIGAGTYYSEVPFQAIGYYGRIKYTGGFAPPGLGIMGVANLNVSDDALLNQLIPDVTTLGSKVWDSLKPRIEQGGLFVAIAEAKDIPRMLRTTASAFKNAWETSFRVMNTARYKDVYYPLRQTRLMQPKFVADQFINTQFGWAPFVKDVNDFLANIINYTDRIQRLAQENGQWIRRRATLVNSTSTNQISSGGEGCFLWPGAVIGGADWTLFYSPSSPYIPPRWEIFEEKTTFSSAVGSFRYWLPEFAGPTNDPFMEKLNAVRRTIDLFGVRASPSNIYKAIPWTWLIDWVTGVGRSIQAIQDQTLDHMAAKYMSLSHHCVTTRVFRQYMPFNPSSGGPKVFDFTQITDVKQRKMASSPFGFFLDAGAMSSRQLAILGALGLSRKRWIRTR
jgi:hypothetical protein